MIPTKDTCTIHSTDFQGITAIVAFRLFRAAAILTLYRYLSSVENRKRKKEQKNSTATSVDQLFQPTQAFLHALDSVQPSASWRLDDTANTVIFTPTEINYNTLRQQTQQYVLILQDPRSIQNTIKFTVRPPRIRTHLKGNGAWNPWWTTALLIQSPDTLPLPTLQYSCGEATCYLRDALQQALHTSAAFLSSIRELQTSHTQANCNLRPAPGGAYTLSHAKKDSSTQLTNFVISIEDPVAYAMLAIQNDPIKTSLNTTTTSRGQTRQHITPLNITAHTRSVLGRT